MEKTKYLILGAGPAGLAFAGYLKQKGEDSFLILEKEEEAGGLCRSMEIDGAPLDIGGGHFLDVRRPKINEFLFGFMPKEEWNLYDRDSRISFDGGYINHPFEANIWQMREDRQAEYLESIAQAGCNNGEEKPKEFVPWIYWKLGQKIAENYMLPYNRKMFGSNLNDLGTYWLEKLPDVSYEETKKSCENKCAFGQQPGHAQFYYPKRYGYGELWMRMQEALKEHMILQADAKILDSKNRMVTLADGRTYSGDVIVTTIPWTAWEETYGIPENYQTDIKKLKYSSLQIAYVPEHMNTKAQWIYYPEEAAAYHRILVRHNFCPSSAGYWTETNSVRAGKAGEQKSFRYHNEYAYPLNTVEKPEIMKRLLAWAENHRIYGLGRWGEHEHYNSDTVVEQAMKLADKLAFGPLLEGMKGTDKR